MTRLVFLISIVMLPAFGFASNLPNRVEIQYKVSWNGMTIGQAQDKFEHDGKQFSIVSHTKTVGMAAMLHKLTIHREARGTITKTGLRAGSFLEERSKKPKKTARFDWETKQITLDSGSGPQTLPMPDHAFDQSSFAWSFAFDPPDGKEGKVALTDGRKLSEYRYAIVGKQKLKTAIGELDTVHIKKILDPGDKRGFEFWLAAQNHYLPVRILFTDDDTTVDSIVTHLSPSANP
ncbi:MAG: DUF3108 domain-containing protein [Betaproteobacteria bacterium]|nr:DUF3108 domain-containing protein [Betaproteobacteria bacterium]